MTKHIKRRATVLLSLLFLILISPASAVNITAADPVTSISAAQDYIPFEIWALLFILTWVCIYISTIPNNEGRDMWAFLGTILSGAVAWLSGYISFNSIQLITINETATIQPVQLVVQPPYLMIFMSGVFFIALINCIRVIWIIYLKPINDAKLQMQGYRMEE